MVDTLNKIIPINLNLTETNVFKNENYQTNETFWTSDVNSAYLEFTTETAITSGTASLVLKNVDDGSIVQRTIELSENTFEYMLREKEVKRAGRWYGQVVVNSEGKYLTAKTFRFLIKGGMLDSSESALFDIENYTKLSEQLVLLYDQFNGYLDDVELSEGKRELAETIRESLFLDSQEARRIAFEASQVDKDNVFAESETNRSETFVASETERNTVFETTQNEKEALFNVKETTRQSNEDERILADSSRKTAFTQSELVRTATFTESESARQVEYIANKSSFDNTLTELETFVNDDATEARFDEKYSELEETYATNLANLKTSDESLTAQLAQTVDEFNKAVSEVTVDSEVILARGGNTTLGERLEGTNDRITTLESDHTVLAENEVTNGDFNKADLSWGSINSKQTATNKTLTNTGDGTLSYPQTYQTVPFTNEHKYYVKANVRALNSECVALRVSIQTYSFNYVGNINNPLIGSWYDLKGIVQANNQSNGLKIYHAYVDGNTAKDKSIEVKNVIAIDLTKTFGVGNEPTVEQMDRLLTQFPNSWFDGTVNIYNSKHMMSVFLKELTKLNNAIIALGGNV